MKRRTKIVCTLGPAVATREKIAQLIDAGMNVARLNCSHGDWETRHQWIRWIREMSGEVGPVAVLADLQGPKFRIGEVAQGSFRVEAGHALAVGRGENLAIPIPQDEIFEAMAVGDRLLIGDGDVELKLLSRTADRFEAKAISGGMVKSRQGVTLVNKSFDVPAITDKDRADVFEACAAQVDFIALSYVRHASDMRELRRLVDRNDPAVKLCAKIETREALKDIDELLKVSDLIMVARGDMGLQMDIEDVPLAQKKIIERSALAGRPVITATQMLESMTRSPRPTRAEATDVANAILDGTDAVMLSGETAAGDYPIETVKTMARLAEKAETLLDHESRMDHSRSAQDPTECVAQSAVRLASSIKVKAVLTTTTSGQTARMVSRFRPRMPILCASWDVRTQRQMAIVWGVEAINIPVPVNTDHIVQSAIDGFLRHKRLKIGDTVVVTAGVPAGTPGNTNLILFETIK